ncbi:biotin-dependent carboxyltransferase family protein [Jeotgalibacillus sp. ET6]|uniref:5-oxoprolinase subunit C family protein n=1 Tax=Jeotgalibacillus sp. ET6 TaxID=3037260 RepID=UPI00241867B5|nr:biotin-dependent carboxyltransferase family protein [Jeotgalibacillus sp. ET6]MDG5472658.1 biotin-dependent carboxyltransferase family protein [Jeotgalibacillus sp. ET6]
MIRIIEPGLLSTVQDEGRHGFQQYGIITNGVMDPFALRIANYLVGNEEKEAGIEVTLTGPTLQFEEQMLIAVCGADFSALLDDEPMPLWRPVLVQKGSILHMKFSKKGCRAVIAVGGGLEIPAVMNSQSTYVRAGIGGFKGRALEKEDVLNVRTPSIQTQQTIKSLTKKGKTYWTSAWSISALYLNNLYERETVRVMEGRQYDEFSEDSLKEFWEESFKLSPQSDRMGYRLTGPVLERTVSEEMLSEAVSFGTIQVPSDGEPIILLADRQTIGGYPKIGQAASVDFPALAQKKPGEPLRFTKISHSEAQKFLIERERDIRELKWGIEFKVRLGQNGPA